MCNIQFYSGRKSGQNKWHNQNMLNLLPAVYLTETPKTRMHFSMNSFSLFVCIVAFSDVSVWHWYQISRDALSHITLSCLFYRIENTGRTVGRVRNSASGLLCSLCTWFLMYHFIHLCLRIWMYCAVFLGYTLHKKASMTSILRT